MEQRWPPGDLLAGWSRDWDLGCWPGGRGSGGGSSWLRLGSRGLPMEGLG